MGSRHEESGNNYYYYSQNRFSYRSSTKGRGEESASGPEGTDAYSPTAAAAQAQWEKKHIYVPFGGYYVTVGPVGSFPTPLSPEERSQEERLKFFYKYLGRNYSAERYCCTYGH